MTGFFASTSLPVIGQTAIPLIAQCGLCKLDQGCRTPKMGVAGKGRRGILILGDFPSELEDTKGRPFLDEPGQKLRAVLSRFDVDLDRDCWSINAARCHPPKEKLPEKAVDHCRPNVVRDVEELKPRTVIVLGQAAVKSVIGWLWRPNPGAQSRWDGFRIPSQKINAWVCPTFDPKDVVNVHYGSQKENEVRTLLFERHLEAACALKGRPWGNIPAWSKSVQVILEPDRAARALNVIVGSGRPVTFDFETDRLKPDSKDAQIWTCSVSNGEMTVAYPWHGRAIDATKKLLAGDLPKIGSNVKFEQRWCLRFGIKVRNWFWDTMLAAHAIDNRPGVSGIEFQAFVLLGVPPWDHDVSPFLHGKSANAKNRIKEIPLERLLRYNCLDSLYEWHVARKQCRIMGVEWPSH